MNKLDWFVTNHGSIFTFAPLTDAAVTFGEEHFPTDCPTFGQAYAVEHRFAHDIADDLLANGFNIGPK